MTTSLYLIQVGLPLAAGALLPSANVMLTPSIAGALMGVSSLGVMANSLMLQLEFSQPPLSMQESLSSSRKVSTEHFERQKALQNANGEAETEVDVEKGLGPREGKFAH